MSRFESFFILFLKLFFNFFVVFLFLGQLFFSADYYKVNNGASLVINEHGVRKNVVNNCALPILVPTKTSSEWISYFIPNKPSCVGVYCPAGESCSGTTDCDGNDNYYISGTQGSTSTSYCNFQNYNDVSNVCNGVGGCVSGTCNSVSTSTTATAGTCRYISGCSGSNAGSVSNYGTSTTCSGVLDCDNNNYYYRAGTQSATSTSYCYYRDYADRNRYCNGAGSCNALSCSSYSNSLRNTAGTCKYISGCSGGSVGLVTNYADGTSCGSGKVCKSGSCVTSYTYSWNVGSFGTCPYYECGTKYKYRTVYCRRSDGTQVDDSFCSGTKPSTSESCGFRSCSSGSCGGPPHCEPNMCGSTGSHSCY